MIKNHFSVFVFYVIAFLMQFIIIVTLPSHIILSVIGGALFAIEVICIVIAWKIKPEMMYAAVFAIYAGIVGHIGLRYEIPYINDIAIIHITLIVLLAMFEMIFNDKSNNNNGEEENG